jgi:hypothetical protein
MVLWTIGTKCYGQSACHEAQKEGSFFFLWPRASLDLYKATFYPSDGHLSTFVSHAQEV